MKRGALAAALMGTALLGSSVPAQAAAAPDPVRAVKSQFVPGHGVKVSEVFTIKGKGQRPAYLKLTGTYGFGTSGVAAYELTLRVDTEGESGTVHFRSVGKRFYMRGDASDTVMPEGKTWWRIDDPELKDLLPSSYQFVDIFRLPRLKSLISHATSVRDGVYRGSFDARQARKVGATWGGSGFDYRLSTDSAGLPTRLFAVKTPASAVVRDQVDTRYSEWGREVTITDPPDHEVADFSSVMESVFEEAIEEPLSIADAFVASGWR